MLDAMVIYEVGNTEMAAFGRNLTGADGYTIGLDAGTSVDFAGLWTFTGTRPPRTYGVSLKQRF
jgi:hypothetical protein